MFIDHEISLLIARNWRIARKSCLYICTRLRSSDSTHPLDDICFRDRPNTQIANTLPIITRSSIHRVDHHIEIRYRQTLPQYVSRDNKLTVVIRTHRAVLLFGRLLGVRWENRIVFRNSVRHATNHVADLPLARCKYRDIEWIFCVLIGVYHRFVMYKPADFRLDRIHHAR